MLKHIPCLAAKMGCLLVCPYDMWYQVDMTWSEAKCCSSLRRPNY
jgi:hypothetical protein